MKKLIPLTLALAAAGAAHAQTTVTLYGIADGDFRVDHTAIGTLHSVGSGGEAASRWGLRGTEDLGGDLKAVFNLEQDVDLSNNSVPQGNITPTTPNSPTTSSGSRMFGRRAIVGLNSTTYGEVRFGREYTPFYQTWSGVDPFGAGFVGRATNYAVGNVVRYDDTMTYESPKLYGFLAKAQVRFGESTTDSVASGSTKHGGDAQSYSLSYANGPIYVGVGYISQKSAIDEPPTYNPTHSETADAAYDLGFLRVSLLYFRTRNQTTTRQQSYGLGFAVPVGAFKFLASVARVDNQYHYNNSTMKFNDANFGAFGVTYALSKRYDLYAAAAKFVNQGAAQNLIGDNSNNGLLTTTNVPAGFNPWSAQVGMRFLF